MDLAALLRLLAGLGLDPAKLAPHLEAATFAALLEQGIPVAVADLNRHGWTPAQSVGHPDRLRLLVRGAEFQLLKSVLQQIAVLAGVHVPGLGYVADALRDRIDHGDRVTRAASAKLTATMTTEAAVRVVVAAMSEELF